MLNPDNDEQSEFSPDYTVKIISYRKNPMFSETFVVFKIVTTKTKQYVVERRYNDFLWLAYRLSEKYPVAILPPLPQKHSLVALERFDGPFIDMRKIYLNSYLIRLSRHPLVSGDDNLWQFLTLTDSELDSVKKTHKLPGKISSIRSSISSFSFSKSNGCDNSTLARFQDQKIQKTIDRCSDISSVMSRIGRVLRRTSQVWKNEEVSIDESLKEEGWGCLAEFAENCGVVGESLEKELEPWIEESALYWDQVSKSVKRRDSIEEKLKIEVSPQSTHRSIVTTIDPTPNYSKPELLDELTKRTANLECEAGRFLEERSTETKCWLDKLAQIHIDHYEKETELWKGVMRNILLNSNT